MTPAQAPPQTLTSADATGGATRLPLIAYARDPESLAILSEVLSPALGPTAEFRPGSLAHVRAGLQCLATPIAALLVDVTGEADAHGALDDLARYVEPSVRVFVIGDCCDLDFYRQLLRSHGVEEYLCKPLNREIVARNLLPAFDRTMPKPVRTGRIVTVTGVRGGVGASTVALNLAAHLASQSRHHILFFDADLHTGTAAMTLSAPPNDGLRVALEDPGRVDQVFIERSAPRINDRLHLLATEQPLDAKIAVSDGAVRHLVSILCIRFNLVVVDLPRQMTPLNEALRELAHVRVLVMDATLPSLRDTLRQLQLPCSPLQASRPVVVLNQLGVSGGLTRKQVVDGLDGAVDVVVPAMSRQAKVATTLGQLATFRRGAFQAAVAKLANEIWPHRSEPARAWSGWWSKIST